MPINDKNSLNKPRDFLYTSATKNTDSYISKPALKATARDDKGKKVSKFFGITNFIGKKSNKIKMQEVKKEIHLYRVGKLGSIVNTGIDDALKLMNKTSQDASAEELKQSHRELAKELSSDITAHKDLLINRAFDGATGKEAFKAKSLISDSKVKLLAQADATEIIKRVILKVETPEQISYMSSFLKYMKDQHIISGSSHNNFVKKIKLQTKTGLTGLLNKLPSSNINFKKEEYSSYTTELNKFIKATKKIGLKIPSKQVKIISNFIRSHFNLFSMDIVSHSDDNNKLQDNTVLYKNIKLTIDSIMEFISTNLGKRNYISSPLKGGFLDKKAQKKTEQAMRGIEVKYGETLGTEQFMRDMEVRYTKTLNALEAKINSSASSLPRPRERPVAPPRVSPLEMLESELSGSLEPLPPPPLEMQQAKDKLSTRDEFLAGIQEAAQIRSEKDANYKDMGKGTFAEFPKKDLEEVLEKPSKPKDVQATIEKAVVEKGTPGESQV